MLRLLFILICHQEEKADGWRLMLPMAEFWALSILGMMKRRQSDNNKKNKLDKVVLVIGPMCKQ